MKKRKPCICPVCYEVVDEKTFKETGKCLRCGADLSNTPAVARYFADSNDFQRKFNEEPKRKTVKIDPTEDRTPLVPKEEPKAEPKTEQKAEKLNKQKAKSSDRIDTSKLDQLRKKLGYKNSPDNKIPEEKPFDTSADIPLKTTEDIPAEPDSGQETKDMDTAVPFVDDMDIPVPQTEEPQSDEPTAPARNFTAPDDPETEPEAKEESLYQKYTDKTYVELLTMRSGKASAEKELKDAISLAFAASDFDAVTKISTLLSGLEKETEQVEPKEETRPVEPRDESKEESEMIPDHIPEPEEDDSVEERILKEQGIPKEEKKPIFQKKESAAEKMRRMAAEDIYDYAYMGPNESKEDTEFSSNTDGYYDDVKADVPPQPDIIKKSSIYKALAFIIGILLLIFFLIYYA